MSAWVGVEEFDPRFLEADVEGSAEGGNGREEALKDAVDPERNIDHWSMAEVRLGSVRERCSERVKHVG